MTLTWCITIMVQLSIADSTISSGDEEVKILKKVIMIFLMMTMTLMEKVTRKKSKERTGQSEIKELLHFKEKAQEKNQSS